ncbi:MAG: F0F1 ATP synthase subunit B [Bacteroidota bacterium]|nr:F0F1 ATP synthase subunit B [Candidatus Kapabacteria bacterium]MDW8220643.1 F0F1 ATP synthase subunit B [Bacteroidota bacterium]
MDNVLSVSPGLIIWTVVNFTVFALILAKFAWKPLLNALHEREKSIQDSITRAEKAQADAERLIRENEAKFAQAQQEMSEIVRQGRSEAQARIQAALQEAERVKEQKIAEARAEIEREKQAAMQALREEVSNLVILATEKILKEKVDVAQQKKLIDTFIDEFRTTAAN